MEKSLRFTIRSTAFGVKAEAESLLRLFNAARSGRVAEMWQEEQMRPMAECLTRAKAKFRALRASDVLKIF